MDQPGDDMKTAAATAGHPDMFGEDLAGASQRALEIAPLHCGACLNYHMLFPLKRHLGALANIPDRSRLVELIAGLVSERAAGGQGAIDIVVAGAADSGVLAVCAHAAHLALGEEARHRVRFTVLDRCMTPLALCQDYARRNQIELELHVADLVSTTTTFPADIVVLHSLFSFIAPGHHRPMLEKFAAWLKPNGRIVFSTELRSRDIRASQEARRKLRTENVRASVASGAFVVKEPMADFYTRLESMRSGRTHASEFENAGSVTDLFARTGLVVVSNEMIEDSFQQENGEPIKRERIVAVLAAPSHQVTDG